MRVWFFSSKIVPEQLFPLHKIQEMVRNNPTLTNRVSFFAKMHATIENRSCNFRRIKKHLFDAVWKLLYGGKRPKPLEMHQQQRFTPFIYHFPHINHLHTLQHTVHPKIDKPQWSLIIVVSLSQEKMLWDQIFVGQSFFSFAQRIKMKANSLSYHVLQI